MASELWLSMDLSSPTGSLALHRKDSELEIVDERSLGSDFTHSERALEVLHQLLVPQGLHVADIDRLVTSSGPGSFTGLRIAMATMKAFCQATGKPLEIVSGSEARALAWSATQPSPLLFDEVYVLTHGSLQKFIRALFQVRGGGSLHFVSETLVEGLTIPTDESVMVLLDERTPMSLLPQDDRLRGEVFPLKARHLAETLQRAASRRTLVTPEEWMAATPQYFGGRF